MAIVKAFRGMRYRDTDKLKDLVTPPYDIISESEQDALYQRAPHNVIRLEYGKQYETDNEEENRYTRAGADLAQWLEEGVLQIEKASCFYVYEEVFSLPDGSKKKIRGLVARVKLQEFSDKVVLPHEETLSKAKSDRFSLMQATNANFSQIYSLYIDKEQVIPNLINSGIGAPQASFTDEEGITQNLWLIEDQAVIEKIEQAFTDKQLFIADGHHRYETALNYKKSLNGANPQADYVMMFLIDLEHDGLVVFPTHRMVKNVAGFDVKNLLDALKEDFTITKIQKEEAEDALKNAAASTFVFYAGQDHCYRLALKDYRVMERVFPNSSQAYRELDVNVLHRLILEKLGIDAENMALQTNLTYTRDQDEALAQVDEKACQCAFLLNATKVEQIKDVSLAGEKMPQKSTYFYPKLKTGLVMNKF